MGAGLNWSCDHDPSLHTRLGRTDCAVCHRDRERARYQANREKHKAAATAWVAANRDHRRAYDRTYAAMQRPARRPTGDAAQAVRDYTAIILANPCVYCGGAAEHVDHIDPIARGGSGEWWNLAPTCARCNRRKSTTSLLHYLLTV